MKKLIIILNDLDQSGKSSLARTVGHYLKDHGFRHKFITTDDRELSDQFEGDFWDLEDELELSHLIGALDRNDAVIVDVCTGSARSWADFCEAHELDSVLSEMDAEMTVAIPACDYDRSHEEIVDLAEIFSDTADYIVAHLPLECRGASSARWRGSYASKVTEYLGAVNVRVPAIDVNLAAALESHDMTLSQAIAEVDNLPRFLEVEVANWLDAAARSFKSATDYLLPETPAVRGPRHRTASVI